MYTKEVASNGWKAVALLGTVTVLFGLAAVFWPHITLNVLVYIFSAWLIISGVIGVVTGIVSASRSTWWALHVILGIVELAFGVYFIRHINVSVTTLLVLAGIVLIVRGLFTIGGAFVEAKETTNSRTLNGLLGLAALVAGVWLLFEPHNAGLVFVWLLGLYALVAGSLEIAIAASAKSELDARAAKK